MVAATTDRSATIDGFWLTPTIGSDSHTFEYKDEKTKKTELKLAEPFVAQNKQIRQSIGILDTPTSVSGLISESSVKDALYERRGSAVYQRDATISVNGNASGSLVREGFKVPSLPTTFTVNVERFEAGLINRVEARYVIRENFKSPSFLNAELKGKIIRETTKANSEKTSFTFSLKTPDTIELIYFVALDSSNVPVAITAPIKVTAPIRVTGSAAVLPPVGALLQPVVNSNLSASNTRTSFTSSLVRTDVDSAIRSAAPTITSLQTSNFATAKKPSPAPTAGKLDSIDVVFAQFRIEDLGDSPLR